MNDKENTKVIPINSQINQDTTTDTSLSVAEVVELIEKGEADKLLELAQKRQVYIIPESVAAAYVTQKKDLETALGVASGIYNEIAGLKDKIIPLIPLIDIFDKTGNINVFEIGSNISKINLLIDLFKSLRLEHLFNQQVLNQFLELSKRYPDAFPVDDMQTIVDSFKKFLETKKPIKNE